MYNILEICPMVCLAIDVSFLFGGVNPYKIINFIHVA